MIKSTTALDYRQRMNRVTQSLFSYLNESTRLMAVFYEDPAITPTDRLRSAGL